MQVNTLISVAFYCGKVFGLLPFSYSSQLTKQPNWRNNEQKGFQSSEEKKFKRSRIGTIFSCIQLCLQIWTCYIALDYLLHAASYRSEALCAQGNFCSVFSLILSHVVISLSVIVIMPLRYRKTIACFDKVDYLLRHRLYKRRHGIPMSSIVFVILLCSVVAKIIIGHVGYPVKRYSLYYTYNLAYVGPIVLIGIIASLCLACEQVFDDINGHLRDLCVVDRSISITHRADKLRTLMRHHWYVSNLVENISKCFALEILIIMVDIYIQLVLFLYLTLWIIFTRKIFENELWPCVSGLLEVGIILCKLVYICYRCDRVIAKGKSTIFQLQHFSSQLNYDLDSKQIAKIFILQLNCREIAITACGFFTINLALLVTITGVVLTYFLVLIQFQVDSEVSRDTSIESRVICVSWPCLEPSTNRTR